MHTSAQDRPTESCGRPVTEFRFIPGTAAGLNVRPIAGGADGMCESGEGYRDGGDFLFSICAEAKKSATSLACRSWLTSQKASSRPEPPFRQREGSGAGLIRSIRGARLSATSEHWLVSCLWITRFHSTPDPRPAGENAGLRDDAGIILSVGNRKWLPS